jgi:hypothetical protein
LEEPMRAWTVDADDIHVAEDFDESLLHRTAEIDSFLSPDRDDKFIVIGTKGFGKTLLLKAKRILYQQERRAACLPTGSLLDKPIGDKIFGKGGGNRTGPVGPTLPAGVLAGQVGRSHRRPDLRSAVFVVALRGSRRYSAPRMRAHVDAIADGRAMRLAR